MRKLSSYRNGNYNVTIFSDGTKIRQNNLDHFDAAFPESIDLKITNQCHNGCGFCYAGSTPSGKHADLFSPSFLDHLHPYTELAIGGGDAMLHPDLDAFLWKMREQKVLSNLTVHFDRAKESIATLFEWSVNRLINGLGISIQPYQMEDHLIEDGPELFPNLVFHVINGLFSYDDLVKLSEATKGRAKVLILGYKTWGRGDQFAIDNSHYLSHRFITNEQIKQLIDDNRFAVISFDNLALAQTNVQSILAPQVWDQFYMGDDGQHTMYVDLVERKYARNSVSKNLKPLLDTIDEMFADVKGEQQ